MMQHAQRHTGSTPLVSVITACLNDERFICDAIASVRTQTFANVEHVIIDDASSDNSRAVIECEGRESGGRLLPIFLNANGGACRARNIGLTRSRGTFVLFLDSDDILLPDAIAELISALAEEKAGLALGGWERLHHRNGVWKSHPADVPLPSADCREALRQWIKGEAWVPPCAIMWRRRTIEALGGWDENLEINQDGDLAMRALVLGVRTVLSPSVKALYRSHGDGRVSLSNSLGKEAHLRSQDDVLRKLEQSLDLSGGSRAYDDAFSFAYQKIAYLAFRSGHLVLGREWRAKGVQLGGRKAVSFKMSGRMLEHIVGLERKEQLARLLRRNTRRLRQSWTRLKDGGRDTTEQDGIT